jgi:DeoR family transcriptional regulator, glycerol-3-phosphate regulon repressor
MSSARIPERWSSDPAGERCAKSVEGADDQEEDVRFSRRQRIGDRQREIVELVGEQGLLTIGALAQRFEVRVQTIRRNVKLLAENGRISRYCGGAGLSSSIQKMEYERRQVPNLGAKQRIAAMAAKDVPDDVSLFISIGTAAERVARGLLSHQHLRVITNNLDAAWLMSKRYSFSVIIAGGTVRNGDGAVTGQAAVEILAGFRVDIALIGIAGIDEDGGGSSSTLRTCSAHKRPGRGRD